MLLSTKHLSGFKIEASDGEIGHVHNFLVDDRNWVVRYVVADVGKWLEGRKVLVAPRAVGNPDGEMKLMPIHLTKNQIEKSPEIDTDMPVSRRQEIRLYRHYQWEPYWIGGVPPIGPLYEPQYPVMRPETTESSEDGEDEDASSHLRSINEMISYRIHTSDGEIGHVADFIVDSEDWAIRYLVVDTRNWLPGKHVIIAPDWIENISWAKNTITVSMTKDSIEDSPEYAPGLPINMEYEARLYDYYGRPKYWE